MTRVTIEIDDWMAEHLKMWHSSGVEAPVNELQSIASWLKTLGMYGAQRTADIMRIRMVILMEAAQAIYDAGAEKQFKIYEYRPDQDPDIKAKSAEAEKQLAEEPFVDKTDWPQMVEKLLQAPNDMLDHSLLPLIKKWDSPPTALQVLEILDRIVSGSLGASFTVILFEGFFDTRIRAEGTTKEEVFKKAHWRY